jgi:hypothetical protein
VAKNVTPLIPTPDLPNYFNNYLNRTANPVKDKTWSLKGDHVFSSAQRISVSMWKTYTDTPSYSPLGTSTPIGFWGFNPVNGIAFRGSHDYVIRPTLLNHFAAGYTASNPIRQRDTRHGNDIYKIPGLPADSPGFATLNVNKYVWKRGARQLESATQRSFPESKHQLHRQHNLGQRPSSG